MQYHHTTAAACAHLSKAAGNKTLREHGIVRVVVRRIFWRPFLFFRDQLLELGLQGVRVRGCASEI
jgi:hypothetical protein